MDLISVSILTLYQKFLSILDGLWLVFWLVFGIEYKISDFIGVVCFCHSHKDLNFQLSDFLQVSLLRFCIQS